MLQTTKQITLIFFIGLFLMACQDGVDSANEQIMTEQVNPSLHFDDFSNTQFTDWNEMIEVWQNGDYQQNCLNVKDFKQDCIDCGDIIVMVEFDVDDSGKISSLVVVEDLIECFNRPEKDLIELKNNIITSFSKLTLPESLRNLLLTVPIGKGTFC